MIFFGTGHLRRTVSGFIEHYHGERNHQGLANRLILPKVGPRGASRQVSPSFDITIKGVQTFCLPPCPAHLQCLDEMETMDTIYREGSMSCREGFGGLLHERTDGTCSP